MRGNFWYREALAFFFDESLDVNFINSFLYFSCCWVRIGPRSFDQVVDIAYCISSWLERVTASKRILVIALQGYF